MLLLEWQNVAKNFSKIGHLGQERIFMMRSSKDQAIARYKL